MNRNIKRSLLTSVLSLLLCVSMLVGSTFAWFTDSVVSQGNIIKSGTLDVQMYWADGKENPDDDATTWTDASAGAIFNNDLWEPGYTEVRHINIKNNGTLALKYQLHIEPTGEVSKLTDAIDVYYIDPAVQVSERTNLSGNDKLGTLTEVLAGFDTTASGTLKSQEEVKITLALKMRETAGNEYQGLGLGSSFNVALLATQLDYEEDTYGPDYDEDLTTPDQDGDMLVEKDGIQYLYRADGSHWLYLVTPEYDKDTVVVPEGVDTIGGSSFSNNTNVKNVVFSSTVRTVRTNSFKNSTVESIVLNEGLESLSIERAFNQAKNLKHVEFPSTLKYLGKQSFALTAMESLTLPATIEVLAEGVFRDMPNLKTVTIKGNTEIGNFAFRSCPNLKTVYLLGDDVTFTGTSQVFTHAGTGDAKGITVYVENETVANRLRAASTSTQNLTIVTPTAVTTNSELSNALVNNSSIVLENGEYSLPSLANYSGIVIDGGNKEETVIGGSGVATGFGSNFGKDTTIKNVTFSGTSNGVRYSYANGGTTTFENCVFSGNSTYGFHIDESNGATFIFNNCTFVGFNAFAADLEKVVFNNCTFLSNGSYGHTNIWSVGEFNNCTWGENATYGTRGDGKIYINGVLAQ